MNNEILYRGRVAGVNFYPAGRGVRVGHVLRPMPTPDNKYDPRAIALMFGDPGLPVGHIPRTETGAFHAHYATGGPSPLAKVIEWHWPSDCRIEVTVPQ
jgi:hypothetical protein